MWPKFGFVYKQPESSKEISDNRAVNSIGIWDTLFETITICVKYDKR